MAPKNKVTVSVQPATQPLTPAERRAAHIAKAAAHQPRLKEEAADRRRARMDDPAGTQRKHSLTKRRIAL